MFTGHCLFVGSYASVCQVFQLHSCCIRASCFPSWFCLILFVVFSYHYNHVFATGKWTCADCRAWNIDGWWPFNRSVPTSYRTCPCSLLCCLGFESSDSIRHFAKVLKNITNTLYLKVWEIQFRVYIYICLLSFLILIKARSLIWWSMVFHVKRRPLLLKSPEQQWLLCNVPCRLLFQVWYYGIWVNAFKNNSATCRAIRVFS